MAAKQPARVASQLRSWSYMRRLSTASSICPFCSLTALPIARPRSSLEQARRSVNPSLRALQTAAEAAAAAAGSSSSRSADNARNELEHALSELQARHPRLVNRSRLQLAIQGLHQPAGDQVIRIAVIGIASGRLAAKDIIKALLADPLQSEQPWEAELCDHDPAEPLVVRVGPAQTRLPGQVHVAAEGPTRELHVSSPALDRLNLEFLLLPVAAPDEALGDQSLPTMREALLTPEVAVPSNYGSPIPLVTPVHRALLVGDGLMGAVHVSKLMSSNATDSIKAAVDLPDFPYGQPVGARFEVVDCRPAVQSYQVFRQGPKQAMEYQRLWSDSNFACLLDWVKSSAITAENSTKPAVKQLITSLLHDAASSLQAEQGACMQAWTPAAEADLRNGLARWAQRAHAELQDELDLAFAGRRWRKLGWWKLFWRVDDVAMLTNEMLRQRFLPTAERELVFFTGRIAQSCGSLAPRYIQPHSSHDAASVTTSADTAPKHHDSPILRAQADTTEAMSTPEPRLKWPGHISFTRRYLQHETIPALQSLAQTLVIQSLATSGVTTSLAALLYVSSWASSLYEAGAVAALGAVYSLGRMQSRWETARAFWEGEVREEGRKAVRGAEESVAAVLDAGGVDALGRREVEEVKGLIEKAEDALARIK